MQASMGQTLNSLLEMNGEYADGDTEESVEANLLQARQALVDAVRTGYDCSGPVTRLLHLKCPVGLKYAKLNVRQIVRDNNQSVAQLKSIPTALGMLEKYGRHLLKPLDQRVDQWRQIKFNNPILKDRVLPMKGAKDVVKQMGYSETVESGLQFVSVEPDVNATAELVADIVLARAEMERYLSGTHPHPDTIHALLPEEATEQVASHWQLANVDVGMLGVQQAPSMALHQDPSPPTPVSATPEGEAEAAMTSPIPASEVGETQDMLHTSVQQFDDSMRKACDICGDEAATAWCQVCDNKQLCEACDEMWHRHPKRTSHHRQPIASLPSPSSAIAPGSNIMGPFGIRAVDSFSVSHGGHLSPVPVSSVQISETARFSNSQALPPTQSTQSQPQSTLDAQASLHQHHQQLHYYQQLQQHQWQQQQLMQQQLHQAGAGGASQFPLTQLHYEHGIVQSYVPGPHQENTHNLSMGRAPGAAPYQAPPPYQVGFEHYMESPQLMPSVSQQNMFHHTPQPDVSLRSAAAAAGPVLPSGFGTNTVPSRGYAADVSLRHSMMPMRSEHSRFSGGAMTESVGVFGHGPRRTSSVSSGGPSTSFLMTKILAEPDYAKRASKCDINIMTLDQELADLEESLNDLMLHNDDFCEMDEFCTLTRRKATLMREHKSLSAYREELAQLMETETQQVDPAGQTQIFHPPPLASSPSSQFGSFTSPQASSLFPSPPYTVNPQGGLGYPQQVSQGTVQTSEYPVLSVNQQGSMIFEKPTPSMGVYSGVGQTHAHYSSPIVQESGAHNRSSVDQSSILPQWQHMPPSATVSSGSNPPIIQPPFYQYGEHPHSPVAMGSVGQITNYPTQATVASPSNRAAMLEQKRNFQHIREANNSPHLVQSQSTVDLTEKPPTEFHRPGSAPSLPQAASSAASHNHQYIASETVQQQEVKPALPERRSVQVLPPPPIQQSALKVITTQVRKIGSPQQEWLCNHCTYINPPTTRVCTMCDRTSDNPTLVSTLQQLGSAMQQQQLLGSLSPSPELAAAIPGLAASKGIDADTKQVDLSKMNRRIMEEQDEVFEEKKEAKRRFLQRLQEEGSLSDQQPTGTKETNAPSLPPRPPPPRQNNVEKSPAAPPERLPAVAGKGQVSGAESGLTQAVQQESRQQSGGVGPRTVGGGGGGGDVGSAHRSGSFGSLDSQTSFIQEGDFSQTMENYSEQKKIREMQLSGRDLMQFIKTADRQGHDLEEVQVALSQCQGKHQEALRWLQTQWNRQIEVVISTTKAKGERGQQNDIGELSQQEARKALKESGGDMQIAVNKCVSARKELYARLNPSGTFAREEVLQGMLHSEGDETQAREQLHRSVLQPFLARVWEGQDGDGAGSGVGLAAGTLLQMAMAESCQSVATSVISHRDFQQTVMNKDNPRDRRIRMVLVEGKLKSWGRAELVIKLLDDYLPTAYKHADSRYTLEDVVEAVRNCRDRPSALTYLTQECSICFAPYPMGKIRNLNFCQCKICSDCLNQNFEVVIREKHVRHWTCPICGYPDLNDADTASEYLNFLGMLLQSQVDREVFELFETKVRDWYLQKDPNFRWCAHCGNGFIADGGQLRMMCPHCSDKTCYKCKKQWEDQHEGLSCEEFAQWKIDNDPSNQAVGLARHLEENGIDCPSCKMRYALAKGGCMHFKCPQCGHEFCSGCYQPFYQRGMCSRLKSCATNGLHAHHPRDCFFYLRDDDVDHLQSLLREANVEFNTTPPSSQEDTARCPVIEQKEFDYGKQDESCGKETVEGHAGLCMTHYKEYLVGLINKGHIDPVIMMTVEDMKKLLTRGELHTPKRNQNDSDPVYRKKLMKFVKEKLPLPVRLP